MHARCGALVPLLVWRSEGNFVESVLHFHSYLGSGELNSGGQPSMERTMLS